MSAGGLSYSGLTSYGKATLPSVSSWGTNNNILRDPPKSIHTRKIDRVGQTSDITRMIDASGDRACEAILQYPRGVNPMVGVSYGNFAGNAGTSGTPTSRSNQPQAKLPYRIGVFRPPILRQENLLPLSRLPRNVTSFGTNPAEVDFSKKMMCPDFISCHDPQPVKRSQFRQIIPDVAHIPVRPTAVYNYETPIKENFEVKYVIQNPVIVSAGSGMRSMDVTQQEVKVPKGNISAHTSYGLGAPISFEGQYRDGENTVDTERYIQDANYSAIASNPGRPMTTPITEIGEVDTRRYLQDPNYSAHTTALSGYEENPYIHEDIYLPSKMPSYSVGTNPYDSTVQVQNIPEYIPEQSRNLPNVHVVTNISDYGETQVSSRQHYLPPRPSYGSFANQGFIPNIGRQEQPQTLNSQKAFLSQRVLQQTMGRSPVVGSAMARGRIPQNHVGPQIGY